MHLELANAMAGASHAAYFDNPYQSDEIGYLENLHIFEDGTCRGFVGSNNEIVLVAFRGTSNRFNSLPHIIQTAQQWLRNLTLFQNDYDGIRVHAGFDEDLLRVYNDVGSLIVDHGGEHKPVLVTGHSAGAAIATLAAQRYKLAELNIHSAYVFASPRVGNRAFVDAYDVPLFRIENMDALVSGKW